MTYYAAAQANLFGSSVFSEFYGGQRFSALDGGARGEISSR